MMIAVFALAPSATVLIMATLGAVLSVRFVLGGASASRRVFAAGLGGPLAVIGPTIGMLFAVQGIVPAEQVIGFGGVIILAFGAIGWPVAHFATRALDRLTRFDPQMFE